MSAINVNSITGRTGTHGPVLTGVTTATNGLNVTGGSVGIGTDDPESGKSLHVFGDTNDTNVKIEATASGKDARLELIANSTGVSQIRLGDEASANPGSITYDHTDNSLALRANSSERLRITSAGNLGIGTISTPNNFKVEIANNGTTGLNIRNTNDSASDSCRIAFSQGSGNLTSSNTFGDIISVADALSPLSGHIKFRTNEGNDLTEKLRILSSGGITFNGDTSVNNALNDYEEGSWTPTYYGATTAGSYSLTSTQAKYTKIGNTVHLYVDIKNIIQSSAGTGLLRIGGLPFTPSNGNEAGSIILENFTFPSSVEYAVIRTSTSNYLMLVGIRNSGVDIQFNVDDRDGGTSDIFGQITYMTSA